MGNDKLDSYRIIIKLDNIDNLNEIEIVEMNNIAIPAGIIGIPIIIKPEYRYINVEAFYTLNYPHETTTATLDTHINIYQVIPIPLYHSNRLVNILKFTNELKSGLQNYSVKLWGDGNGYIRRIIYYN